MRYLMNAPHMYNGTRRVDAERYAQPLSDLKVEFRAVRVEQRPTIHVWMLGKFDDHAMITLPEQI